MKIDLALTACDLNEHYINLYPLVYKTWKQRFGIDCHLILIAEEIPQFLSDFKEFIILFKPIPNIHTAFISQVIRILYPALYSDKTIIISDADIFPISKEYFIDSIKNIDPKAFVAYRDAYYKQNMTAICYNVAHSDTWKEIFGIKTLDDVINKIVEWYPVEYNGQKNCTGWYIDQKKLFEIIHLWAIHNPLRFVQLHDKSLKFKRLDKRQREYILNNLDIVEKNVLSGMYSDFHTIKPYQMYKNIIERIVDAVIKSS